MLQVCRFFCGIALLAMQLEVSQASTNISAGGQVVWWGNDIFWKNSPSDHTNGVVESGDEILCNVVGIAALHLQAFLLTSDGAVFTSGLTRRERGTVPTGLSNIVSIIQAGDGGSLWAIRRDGSVARWGGDEDNENILAGLSNITAVIRVGAQSYLALKTDGSVLGFRFDPSSAGASIDPATGLPTAVDERTSLRPVKVDGQILSNVVAMASMGDSPLVLTSDGKVMSLGRQIGGASAYSTPPFGYAAVVPVTLDGLVLSNVTALASGAGHCLALTSNGAVVAWGNNHYGEATVPADLSNVVAIAAAEHLSLALKRDGTVVAWGGNYFGQTSVPAGLSNVTAIAAGGWFSMAITTGAVPASVYVQPHGRLEELEREADLIFKGEVVSSTAKTNDSFPSWGHPHATKFRLISVLKGSPGTNEPIFWHNTTGPMGWSGGREPSHHQFKTGRGYLVFAVNLGKPTYLYSPPADATSRAGEFRQTCFDGVLRCLDDRPLDDVSIKEAHWLELNRLLMDAASTNSLYAIRQLNEMSKSCLASWGHSGDFKREAVLAAVMPLVTNRDDKVAVAAIGCFQLGGNTSTWISDQGGWIPILRGCSEVQPECVSQVFPYAPALVRVANESASTSRRVAAVAAFACTRFPIVSNALPRWLRDKADEVRAQAVLLLPDYPGEFSEHWLREMASDASPTVRAVTADAIGNGVMTNLLPTLVQLFSDPVGRDHPLPPLTPDELGGGGRANISGDVHIGAGYALLKFDANQVSEILKTNLNDTGFRLQFLCKLAEAGAGPWIDDMTEIMETRRAKNLKKAQDLGWSPDSFMYLSGTYGTCWRIIYEHLKGLPYSAFADRKSDRYLKVLEQAGNTGSGEPLLIYELYKMKGLNRRAARFRTETEKTFGWVGISEFFDKVEARYPNNGFIPDQ